MPTDFTRVTSPLPNPTIPGQYQLELDGNWNAPINPHGGLVAAIGVRAMEMELAIPEQTLRSVNTVFVSPILEGKVIVDVTVLRKGRSISQAMALVRNEGSSSGLIATAIFGSVRDGYSFVDLVAPIVPPPDKCRSFWDNPPRDFHRQFEPTFWYRVEGRSAIGHAPWESWEPTTSEKAVWHQFKQVPFLPDGTLDPLALVTLCDTMPGAVGEKVGPGQPVWVAPSTDLTVHLGTPTTSEWILGYSKAHWASEGYASLDISLWDPLGKLLAYGTQVCFFHFPGI